MNCCVDASKRSGGGASVSGHRDRTIGSGDGESVGMDEFK